MLITHAFPFCTLLLLFRTALGCRKSVGETTAARNSHNGPQPARRRRPHYYYIASCGTRWSTTTTYDIPLKTTRSVSPKTMTTAIRRNSGRNSRRVMKSGHPLYRERQLERQEQVQEQHIKTAVAYICILHGWLVKRMLCFGCLSCLWSCELDSV